MVYYIPDALQHIIIAPSPEKLMERITRCTLMAEMRWKMKTERKIIFRKKKTYQRITFVTFHGAYRCAKSFTMQWDTYKYHFERALWVVNWKII